MDTLSFDNDFLLKYGGLFHTVRLDVFAKHVDKLNSAIRKKFVQRISIYWYVHMADNENEILFARHMQMDSSKTKDTRSFSVYFKKAFVEKYPYLALEKQVKFNVSYVIIKHNELNQQHLWPTLAEKSSKEKLHINYQINRDFCNAFSKVEKYSPFEEKVPEFLKSVATYLSQNFTKIAPVFLAFFTFILLIRLISIPTDSIQFQSLSFSISSTLFFYIFVIVSFCFVIWLVMIGMSFLLGLASKRIQMNSEMYVSDDAKTYAVSLAIVLILILFIVTAYKALFTDSDPFSDIALPIYLGDTQSPSYMQIKFQDLNESKTSNVLYVYENSQNTYFLYDDDLNSLIYRNQDLTKSLCMGDEKKSYVESMLPMIYAKTFDNQMYRKTRTRTVQLSAQDLPFQETFCFKQYPEAIRLKSNNQVLILMGQPDPDNNEKLFYYYDFTTVKKDILSYHDICDVNNSHDFIKKMMRSEVLKNFEYRVNELDQNDFEEWDIYQYACQNKK